MHKVIAAFGPRSPAPDRGRARTHRRPRRIGDGWLGWLIACAIWFCLGWMFAISI